MRFDLDSGIKSPSRTANSAFDKQLLPGSGTSSGRGYLLMKEFASLGNKIPSLIEGNFTDFEKVELSYPIILLFPTTTEIRFRK
mgnify:CR=1 FL=1